MRCSVMLALQSAAFSGISDEHRRSWQHTGRWPGFSRGTGFFTTLSGPKGSIRRWTSTGQPAFVTSVSRCRDAQEAIGMTQLDPGCHRRNTSEIYSGKQYRQQSLYATSGDITGSDATAGYSDATDTNNEWYETQLVDRCRVVAVGGRGGNGCVSFRREKHVPLGGADGGNGGPGGSVYLVCDDEISNLNHVKKLYVYKAENGKHGMGDRRNGAKGRHCYISVPPGTHVYSMEGELHAVLQKKGDRLMVVRGGRGGKGNRYYKTKFNTAPHVCERGEEPITRELVLNYKMLGNVALVGKPNSGKSSMLRCLSRARPRVSSQAFSTKFPILGMFEVDNEEGKTGEPKCEEGCANSGDNIEHSTDNTEHPAYNTEHSAYEDVLKGVYVKQISPDNDTDITYSEELTTEYHPEREDMDTEYWSDLDDTGSENYSSFHTPESIAEVCNMTPEKDTTAARRQLVIADIPGLIEGASAGKGLGHQFLKHIENANVLAYVIDVSIEDPLEDYRNVRKEISLYNEEMLKRLELVILNKIDLIEPSKTTQLLEMFRKETKHDRIYAVSAKTRINLEQLKQAFKGIYKMPDVKKDVDTDPIDIAIDDPDDFRKLNPRKFKLEQLADGEFRVVSKYLERKVPMMRFDLRESLDRLRRILKINGIHHKLRRMGVKPGDILHIGTMSFEVNELAY